MLVRPESLSTSDLGEFGEFESFSEFFLLAIILNRSLRGGGLFLSLVLAELPLAFLLFHLVLVELLFDLLLQHSQDVLLVLHEHVELHVGLFVLLGREEVEDFVLVLDGPLKITYLSVGGDNVAVDVED